MLSNFFPVLPDSMVSHPRRHKCSHSPQSGPQISFHLYPCDIFYGALCTSGCIASNGRIVTEKNLRSRNIPQSEKRCGVKPRKTYQESGCTGQNWNRVLPTELPLYHWTHLLVFKMSSPQFLQVIRAVLGTSVMHPRSESN